jgi:hypothetical protein
MGKSNSGWTIGGLIFLLIVLLAIFPDKFAFLLQNKFYMMISGLAVFLIIFLFG